jgi:hypothetical protein
MTTKKDKEENNEEDKKSRNIRKKMRTFLTFDYVLCNLFSQYKYMFIEIVCSYLKKL